jgi:hypothetical protein
VTIKLTVRLIVAEVARMMEQGGLTSTPAWQAVQSRQTELEKESTPEGAVFLPVENSEVTARPEPQRRRWWW